MYKKMMEQSNKITFADEIVNKIVYITTCTSTTYGECMKMNIDELLFFFKKLYIANNLQNDEWSNKYYAMELHNAHFKQDNNEITKRLDKLCE